MASLAKRNGHWNVQFFLGDSRKRHTLYLGKMAEKTARLHRANIEHLIARKLGRESLPRETAMWLSGLNDELHGKLAKAGLVGARDERDDAEIPLDDYLGRYIKSRTDLKPLSISNLTQVRRWLVKHFGPGRNIRTITRGDIGDWHRLIKSKLSAATVSAHVKKARQMFQDAVDRELIAKNPLHKLKAGVQTNAARQAYVPESTVYRIIDACPDTEWKLIFAMARWGGVRIPSELHGLRWGDINWEAERITIRSPKTAHHGKATREIPLFPELKPLLLEAFELTESDHEKEEEAIRAHHSRAGSDSDGVHSREHDGGAAPQVSEQDVSGLGRVPLRAPQAGYVIARHRGGNLATHALRIIERAGVTVRTDEREKGGRHKKIARPWPKLFQNMRSSRQTDLEARHPSHVACAWMGNTETIARRHYLQVTDADFAAATQSAAQSAAVRTRQHPTESKLPEQKSTVNTGNREIEVPAVGFQHPAELPEFLRTQEQALQKALQSLQTTSSKARARDIAKLEREVRKARRKAVSR